MNIYGIIILIALIFEFALELLANLLNLRSITFKLPPVLDGIYKIDEYQKSQEYIKTRTIFSLVHMTINLLVLLFIWFTGCFNLLDQLIRSWNLPIIVTGILYTGILLLAYEIFTSPFKIYDTFIIEERFGFNKTTKLTFLVDQFKGLGLALVLGLPVLAAILWLFEYVGSYAWLYCWIMVTLFSLIMQYVAPTWILPLFNKFTPMESGELKEAIMNYIKAVKFPVKNIFVMDGSKRSRKSNAFFTGFGRNKRIALFDTLIAKHDTGELVAILAHEVGHYKKKHITQGLIISIIHTGILFLLLSIFLGSPGLYQAFNMQEQSVYVGLLFFGLLYTPIEVILSIFMNILSRKNEYEADRFAMETTENPNFLVEALKKLHTTNLSNLTPHPFYVFLNYSHPPLLQRVQAIQNMTYKKY